MVGGTDWRFPPNFLEFQKIPVTPLCYYLSSILKYQRFKTWGKSWFLLLSFCQRRTLVRFFNIGLPCLTASPFSTCFMSMVITVSQDKKAPWPAAIWKHTQLTPGANVHGETTLGCPKVLGFFLKKLHTVAMLRKILLMATKNPAITTWDVKNPAINNGISTTFSLNWWVCRISEPSTVSPQLTLTTPTRYSHPTGGETFPPGYVWKKVALPRSWLRCIARWNGFQEIWIWTFWRLGKVIPTMDRSLEEK